jgi:maltooligosyltrehalose trehalohydrolase
MTKTPDAASVSMGLSRMDRPGVGRDAARVQIARNGTPCGGLGEDPCRQPFPFFCDVGGDLADAVREGRRAEFARFAAFADPASRARIPDPLMAATFAAAVLRWEERDTPEGAATLDWHRRILAVRREPLVPLLPRIRRGGEAAVLAPGAVTVRWAVEGGGRLDLLANLSPAPLEEAPAPHGRLLWQEGEARGPGSVRCSLG